MSKVALREALNQLCAGDIDVDGLASACPNCICESAPSPTGSPGPIINGEVLRLFLTSPTHVRVKQPADLAKRPFRAADLKRAYSVGLSVCRLAHASQEELAYTANQLCEVQRASNGDLGGVIGAVDFPVTSVRTCPVEIVPLCAYETPLDPRPEGGYLRASHGDVVNSRNGMSPEEQKASRDVIFNQIVESGKIRKADQIDDFTIADYLPKTAV